MADVKLTPSYIIIIIGSICVTRNHFGISSRRNNLKLTTITTTNFAMRFFSLKLSNNYEKGEYRNEKYFSKLFLRQKKSEPVYKFCERSWKSFRFAFITTLQNDEYADVLIDLFRVKYKNRGNSFWLAFLNIMVIIVPP